MAGICESEYMYMLLIKVHVGKQRVPRERLGRDKDGQVTSWSLARYSLNCAACLPINNRPATKTNNKSVINFIYAKSLLHNSWNYPVFSFFFTSWDFISSQRDFGVNSHPCELVDVLSIRGTWVSE